MDKDLARMKEILESHGIELQILYRHDKYYIPFVTFKYKGETIIDRQTDFNNMSDGGYDAFEGGGPETYDKDK